MVRSKDSSLGFVENISGFLILRRDIKKVRSLYKFDGVKLNI